MMFSPEDLFLVYLLKPTEDKKYTIEIFIIKKKHLIHNQEKKKPARKHRSKKIIIE